MPSSHASARTDRIPRPRKLAIVATLVAVLTAAGLASSAVAQADLSVSHVSYTAAETAGDGDNIIGPGDSFSLSEKVVSAYNNGGVTTLTNVAGTLQTGASGVTISQPTSAYPDLTFGTPQSNTTLFQGSLAGSLDCGVSIPMTLQLSADQGTQAVPFVMQTGAQGAFNAYTSTQVPLVIPSNGGQIVSSVNVATAGRVKHLKVSIGNLSESYDGDLLIELIAPDGTDVHLVEPHGVNTGRNFIGTTFDDSAANGPITTSTGAPYSGSYQPASPLSAFVGHQQQGNWQLRITDSFSGDNGTLNSWGQSVAPAVCTTTPIGSFTATPNPAGTGTTVSFDGSGSTSPSPGATITDYKWNFGDGSPVVDSGATATTSHVYSTRGQYTVTLTVTDSNSKTGSSSSPVSITTPPLAAIAASPTNPVAGQQISFDASASTHDPSGSIVDYRWDLDGSGTYATDTGPTPNVSVSYPTQRQVTVSVRITDDVGATSTASKTITVGNAPPVASFQTPTPILVGAAVQFDGSASHDIDGTIVNYAWDLAGAGTYSTSTGLTPTVTTSYSSPGVYTVGLRVTDDGAATAQTTHQIQVTRPPVAQLKATPSAPTAGQMVTLDASGSTDPDGAITSYQWDLDGSGQFATSSGSTSALQHAFAAGTYTIRVRVTDNFGATATSAPLTLTVTAPAGSGGGGGGGGTGQTLLALVGPTVGGNPQAGIAALTGGDLKTIVAGSDIHFTAITGAPLRKRNDVAKRGLWVNLLSDRAATFNLTVSVAAIDAQRLHIASVRRHSKKLPSGLRAVTSVSTSLTAAGQRPYDIVLPASVRSKLKKLRGALQLIVTGTAADAKGNRTALTRAFQVKG